MWRGNMLIVSEGQRYLQVQAAERLNNPNINHHPGRDTPLVVPLKGVSRQGTGVVTEVRWQGVYHKPVYMDGFAMTEAAIAPSASAQAAAQTTAPTKGNAQQSEPKPVYSRPVFKQNLTVYTLQAQRVVERSLSRVSYSLFSLDVILQIIGIREQVDEVSQIVQGHITKADEQLDERIQQMDVLFTQHEIQDVPSYTNPISLDVEITSPQVAQFMRLVRKLDQLMAKIDSLWLHGLLTSKQRTQAGLEWQQLLNRLASRIIGVEKRARVAAHNQGKRDEVDAAAPSRHDNEVEDENEDDDESKGSAKPKAAAKKPAASKPAKPEESTEGAKEAQSAAATAT